MLNFDRNLFVPRRRGFPKDVGLRGANPLAREVQGT